MTLTYYSDVTVVGSILVRHLNLDIMAISYLINSRPSLAYDVRVILGFHVQSHLKAPQLLDEREREGEEKEGNSSHDYGQSYFR